MRIIDYRHGISLGEERGLVVALGLFDGVHKGHRELISRAVTRAEKEGLIPAVFTFKDSSGIKSETSRIYPECEKYSIFERLGIELVISADFESVRDISREDFVGTVLSDLLGARVAVAGKDFRFGRGALGDSDFLWEYGSRCGLSVEIVSMASFTDERGNTSEISSTVIRDLLGKGRVDEAGLLLGEPYHIVGRVEHGRGVGRTLGYPTVNISLPKSSPLGSGVYETRLKIGEKLYTGLTNVGVCPTFEPREKHTETYILDYEGDAYFSDIRLDFLRRVREERRFGSAEELGLEIERNISFILGEK